MNAFFSGYYLRGRKRNELLSSLKKKVLLYLSLKHSLLLCSTVPWLTKLLELKGQGRLPLNGFPLSRGLPYPNLVRLLELMNLLITSLSQMSCLLCSPK